MRKLHAFVRERHPNAVFLGTVVVNRVLVEQLEALADGAVAEASWFEVTAPRCALDWPSRKSKWCGYYVARQRTMDHFHVLSLLTVVLRVLLVADTLV